MQVNCKSCWNLILAFPFLAGNTQDILDFCRYFCGDKQSENFNCSKTLQLFAF
jgi:hypothetical protein